jgi:hypothetical protein
MYVCLNFPPAKAQRKYNDNMVQVTSTDVVTAYVTSIDDASLFS